MSMSMSALSNFRMSMSEYEFGDSEVCKYELSMSKENLPTSEPNSFSHAMIRLTRAESRVNPSVYSMPGLT